MIKAHKKWKPPDLIRDSGWTIIELLIGVGLLMLLSSIAIPNIAGWYPKYRLRAAANDLCANLQLAKTNAVKENSSYAVVFDRTGGRYFICSDAGADDIWSTFNDNTKEKTVLLSNYKQAIGSHSLFVIK